MGSTPVQAHQPTEQPRFSSANTRRDGGAGSRQHRKTSMHFERGFGSKLMRHALDLDESHGAQRLRWTDGSLSAAHLRALRKPALPFRARRGAAVVFGWGARDACRHGTAGHRPHRCQLRHPGLRCVDCGRAGIRPAPLAWHAPFKHDWRFEYLRTCSEHLQHRTPRTTSCMDTSRVWSNCGWFLKTSARFPYTDNVRFDPRLALLSSDASSWI